MMLFLPCLTLQILALILTQPSKIKDIIKQKQNSLSNYKIIKKKKKCIKIQIGGNNN